MTREELQELVVTSNVKADTDALERVITTQEDASVRSPGVPAHYYRFLYRLVQTMKPKLCVELGTHTGISAACLAEGYLQGKVVTINHTNQLREDYRRPNVTYLTQDSLVEYKVPAPIDILFIDTEHNGKRCLGEYDLYIKRMAQNGIVFFDDIFLNEEMKSFWQNFNPPEGEKLELPVHGWAGFGVVILRPSRP